MLEKLCKHTLAVGHTAPLFSLPDQSGTLVHLKDVLARGWVVLYFYPKDNTRHCTVESQEFRDNYATFKNAQAEVIGVSSDSTQSHANFAREFNLPFTLLSDHKAKVRKLYGVPATFGLIPGRVTYVIDSAGKIRDIFNSQFNPRSHVKQALSILDQHHRP